MQENNCFYISSVGFRKSCDMYSNLETDNTNEYNFDNLKDNNILYIKTDAIYHFSKNINRINNNFVLVSGCSDYTVPNNIFPNIKEFISFIENSKINKWFVQNCIFKHNKIINLPIGLDYHTLHSKDFFWGPQKNPIEQEKEILGIKQKSIPFYERQILIYSNCHFSTTTKFGYDRIDAINKIPKNLIKMENSKISRIETWNNQINFAFVLSPHGNGLDCHRTWEALILGCIPIVKSSLIDVLYEDLPVLIVQDWTEINQDILINTINVFKNKNFNLDKLNLNYWIKKMKDCAIN
jgi:hypothetical protein